MTRRKKIIGIVLLVAICLGAVVTRAFFEGSSALERGDRAQAAGEMSEAVRWWRRAARWYVPGAPHVSGAYDRLKTLAVEAEKAGDTATALSAWRGIRSSILATRSFYTPYSEELEPANRHIADLMARIEGQAADPKKSESERAEWHYQLLARDESPSVAWSFIAILAFMCWLGGGVVFALYGITAEDELVPRRAAIAGAMIAIGLLVWVFALYQA